MISKLPLESMDGHSEWDWNEQRAYRKPLNSAGCAADHRPGGIDRNDSSEEAVTSRREVEKLEAELERKEQQLQHVTEQYELLLDEKNRQLADRSGSGAEGKLRSTFCSVISRYVTDR